MQVMKTTGQLQCEVPNANLHHFKGRFQFLADDDSKLSSLKKLFRLNQSLKALPESNDHDSHLPKASSDLLCCALKASCGLFRLEEAVMHCIA